MTDEELNEAVQFVKGLAQPIGLTRRHWRMIQQIVGEVERRGLRPSADPQVDDLYEQPGAFLSAVIAEAKTIREKLTPAQESSLIGRREDGKPGVSIATERTGTRLKLINLGVVGADGGKLTELGRVVLSLIDRERGP